MKLILKQIAIGLIFSSFLLYTCGVHVFYELKLRSVKERNHHAVMQHDIEHQLVNLEIPVDEISWFEEDEFKWKGRMYDVAEKKIIDGILVCSVYQDEEEMELMEAYSAHHRDAKTSKQQQQITKIIQPFVADSNLFLYFEVHHDLMQQFKQNYYDRIDSDFFSPPPEV